jgi:hypothetical protein
MAKMACAQCGGAKMKKGGKAPAKKMQKGGSMGIVGMPKYGNNPMTDEGRMLQKGGAFAPNRAVQASCKGGMVRDENGRCVMQRKMKEGGFPDLTGDNKVTQADILKGRGVFKKGGENWIKGAIKRPGAFSAKAKAAGMSTSAFAAKVSKPGSKASTLTKRQANLAKTLGKMRKK